MSTPNYEIHAVRYAELERRASENFLGGDPHDGPMPMDFFGWAVVRGGRTFVVDTGFSERDGQKRGRKLLRTPPDGLRAVGIDPDTVKDVIVTHMHYDHAGNIERFPNAKFHVQDV